MNSKNKISKERFMDKIKVLHAYVDFLNKGHGENQINSIIVNLNAFNISFEQLRQESSQELICRFIASEHEGLDQGHFMELVKYKDVIYPEIIVWVQAEEICQVFGLQLKDLSKYEENGQLSMLILGDYKFFDWSELKNLIGSS